MLALVVQEITHGSGAPINRHDNLKPKMSPLRVVVASRTRSVVAAGMLFRPAAVQCGTAYPAGTRPASQTAPDACDGGQCDGPMLAAVILLAAPRMTGVHPCWSIIFGTYSDKLF